MAGAVAHGDDDGVVVISEAPDGGPGDRPITVLALGDSRVVAEVLSDVAAGAGKPLSVSVPVGTWELLPAELVSSWELHSASLWDWMWTDSAPPVVTGEDEVMEVSPSDFGLIEELHAVAMPGTRFTPSRLGSRWFARRRTDGSLGAVVGSLDWRTAVHLGGIAAHPELTGLGWGTAATAAVTRLGHERFGQVSLGVYAANVRAIALYRRLGYALGHQVESHHPS